jgi:putative transposase
MAEKALAAVVQEAYVQGVSTRSVDELVKAMGMSGISKSQVSRLCEEIDEKVTAFLERPIESDWPYLWIDATYVKVRQNGRIVSVAVTRGSASMQTAGVRFEASTSAPPRPRRSGPPSCASSRGADCAASSSSSPTPTKASRPPSPTCCRRAGSAAACTSCATSWRTPAIAGAVLVSAFIATAFAQDNEQAARAQWRKVAELRAGHECPSQGAARRLP